MNEINSTHVPDGNVVKQHVAEKRALINTLRLYVDCRHGNMACRCTAEARAALYPYLRREATIEKEQPKG